MNILKALELSRPQTPERVSAALFAVHLENKSKPLHMITLQFA